ncbi:hypothetical protein ACQE98_02380 [Ornithinimicrobium sp. W1679]|uniref:hypothetical protein n=1 Tax=unclassified Ornithinimicrobium TaxID=2615080 RepID=UPI003CED9B81
MSSLIFVVILAVWAVYLVQHWVRRRDHLATARSVDRFSEAMRVLERRRALPRPETAEVAPRPYDTSPLRPARPEVVVKRHDAPAGLARAAHGARAVAPPPAVRRAQVANRLRGAALLVSSVVLVAASGLAMAGTLPRWSALAAVAFLGLTVGVVRWSAAQERAARRRPVRAPRVVTTAARPAGRRAPHRAPTPEHADRPGQRPAGRTADHALAAQSLAVTTRPGSRRSGARRTVVAADRPAPALYDVAAVEAGLDRRSAVSGAGPTGGDPSGATSPAVATPSARDGAAGGTWDPVPVPPPTYALKARASRGVPEGTGQLPEDGTVMALEEEFEDLPHVDRVG